MNMAKANENEKLHLLQQREKGEVAGELKASYLSRYTFWWIVKTLITARRRPLTPEDIYEVSPEYAAADLANRIRSFGSTPTPSSGFSIAFRVFKAFLWRTVVLSILYILTDVCRLSLPIFLHILLDFISGSGVSQELGYTSAALLVLAAGSFVYLTNISRFEADVFGMILRAGYSNLIYRKVLKVQSQNIMTGNLIKLLSTDAERVCQSFQDAFEGLAGAFVVPVVVCILYLQHGWFSLVGLGVLGSFLLTSFILSAKYAKMRLSVAKATDVRVRLMNEVINAMRIIKMNCWENKYQDVVTNARKEEIREIMRSNILQGVATGIARSSGTIATAAIFVAYYVTGLEITGPKVFATLLYCTWFQQAGIRQMTGSVQNFGQTLKCLERIEDFLLVKEDEQIRPKKQDFSPSKSFKVNHAYASWGKYINIKTSHLKNLTFSCEKNDLVGIAGSVGAGKTSLLMLLAGEIPLTEGHVSSSGRLSYCPQDPWIFHGTVRENILFGQEMELQRFKDVLTVCALNEDLNNMPDEDLTLIGEKGLTLSGGQKARVSLARAIYVDADIYLLDDPLSALDTKVGRHVFQSCIKTFLKGKTTVLATHQVQYLRDVDKVILMREGEICYFGSYHDLPDKVSSGKGVETTYDESDSLSVDSKSNSSEIGEDVDNKAEETTSWKVYILFVKAGGVMLFLATMLLFVLTQGTTQLSYWYLGKWVSTFNGQGNNTFTSLEEDRAFYAFTGLAFGSTLLSAVIEVPLFIFFALAAKRLHESMFHRLMRAPTRFFDTNPIGRVLNRFTRDMGFVDLLIPTSFRDTIRSVFNTCGQFGLACVMMPLLTLVLAVILLVVHYIYQFSVRACVDLKRLEAAARSPVYSHLSETLRGVQSIRIMRKESDFQKRFSQLQDGHTMRWLMYIMGFRWMGFIIYSTLVVLIAFAVILAVVLREKVAAVAIGLCISSLLLTLGSFGFIFRNIAKVDSFMTSVERILQYSTLDQEPHDICGISVSDKWPEAGGIQFETVSLYYYQEGPAALKDICVHIKPEERIGIVGRTGSGKSSLIHCLLRLTEPCGSIYVDGVNISSIGLHTLRDKISVIPQDATLFSGTLRRNLDPHGLSSEQELWTVLQKVRMAEKVKGMPGGLDADLLQGGSNLSYGQRQLICLARALLKQNKIVVMDEATANIDKETDKIIQAIIRLHLRRCTVLIIAHRLDTIMDCNRVMVLANGVLMEYDVPYLLLQKPDSFLNKYAQLTGPEHAKDLYETAREAYINRLSL